MSTLFEHIDNIIQIL